MSNIEDLIDDNLEAKASIWDESSTSTNDVNATIDGSVSDNINDRNSSSSTSARNNSSINAAAAVIDEAPTGLREDSPVGSAAAAAVPSHNLAPQWTAQWNNMTSVPNPLLSNPFFNLSALPTDEAQIRLQVAVAAQLSQQDDGGPPKKPMMVASTGNNESVAVLNNDSSSYIISQMPAELFEPVPLAPGFHHEQQRQQQQQQQQQRASQAVEDKESNEIRPLMDGLTSYQEPRAKLTSADISDIKQQAAGDSMNEASSSTCIAPSSMPQNRLPMPPIYATSAETFACSNATSSGSSNIHYPAETLPLPVGIAPPQQKQSQHQQVDINTHSSMLASVIGTPKGDGRDIVDATLFSRHTPIQANPMWMNTCKIETKQEESATSKQGTAERTSKMHAARSTRSKEAEPVAKRAVRIFSHKMDEKDNETQSPQDFFIDLIGKRGYSTNSYSSLDCGYHTAPSPLQLASFGTAVIKAVESDDSEQLSALLESGLSRNPCSSFSDYILCRSIKKGCVKSFRAQVEAGADLRIADDFGRTALHHAAWAQSPNFEIVDVILKADKNMLRLTDRLGRTPLNYAHGAHRAEWIEHLKEVVNDFWPENGKDWHEEEVPPKVVREGGMIADPADALPAHEASLIAMGKVAPTATDGKNTVSTSSDTPESDASETSASAGKRKKLDTSNSRQNFVNAKKLATRSPSSGKKVVASRCA
mmetsp:Transcript_17770/g.38619  ORF Transcript_17770/g.38619 Transcript_17770/m.38619 type:complete len:705 (+) Transcript_17770:296-2410(+)